LKSKCHNLAIGRKSYFEILGRCTLTNYLKDPTIGFIEKTNIDEDFSLALVASIFNQF